MTWLTAGLLATSTIVAPVQVDTGRDLVLYVVDGYQKGAYNKFLKHVNHHYQKGLKGHKFDRIRESMELYGKARRETPMADVMQDEEYHSILNLCLENPDSDIANSLKSSLFFYPSEPQREALNYLFNELPYLAEPTSPDEAQLLEIAVEYHLKARSLDEPLDHEGSTALEWDMLTAMQSALDEHSELQETLLIAKEVYPAYKAHQIDKIYLDLLSRGKLTPQTPFEQALFNQLTQ